MKYPGAKKKRYFFANELAVNRYGAAENNLKNFKRQKLFDLELQQISILYCSKLVFLLCYRRPYQ